MAVPKTDTLMVATESFVSQDGQAYHKDITRVSSAVVKRNKWDHLFKPAEVSHPEVEAATAGPGEKRG